MQQNARNKATLKGKASKMSNAMQLALLGKLDLRPYLSPLAAQRVKDIKKQLNER